MKIYQIYSQMLMLIEVIYSGFVYIKYTSFFLTPSTRHIKYTSWTFYNSALGLHSDPMKYYYYPHFTNEETDVSDHPVGCW